MPSGLEKPDKEKVETTRIKEVRCYRGMSGRIESRKLGQEEKRVRCQLLLAKTDDALRRLLA